MHWHASARCSASIFWRDKEDVHRRVYGLTGGLCAAIFLAAVVPRGAHAFSTTLPLGIPWLGMHFRLDPLAAFFLAVINLAARRPASTAIGYGAHEKNPSRVLPSFPPSSRG
ncbi:hypothetical protein [Methylocystis parvus]|uniref:hypothetical protein n=1 Tax=Methylocystis parvus TaxID=134 RepID=UPI003C75C52C